MKYQFRDDTYQGTTIRFIKAYKLNSHGFDIAPVDELYAISKQLVAENPDMRVIVMSGRGSLSHSPMDDFIGTFLRDNPPMRDNFYQWQDGNSNA